jgi:hypothetical protein
MLGNPKCSIKNITPNKSIKNVTNRARTNTTNSFRVSFQVPYGVTKTNDLFVKKQKTLRNIRVIILAIT